MPKGYVLDGAFEVLPLLYAALEARYGIVLRATGDRDAARQLLHRIRAAHKDHRLNGLKFIFSPYSAEEIWIVRHEAFGAALAKGDA